jgi:hypothetical protein
VRQHTPSARVTAGAVAATTAPFYAAKKEDGGETMTRARALLESQRKSVAMLKVLKDAIDRLPLDMEMALSETGFWYGHNILDAADIVDELQSEGDSMLFQEFMT